MRADLRGGAGGLGARGLGARGIGARGAGLLCLRPGSPGIRALCLALLCLGPGAPGVLRPALAAEPEVEVQRTLQAAAELFRAERYDEALTLLRRVEHAVGEDASVRWNIARCLEELGRTKEAVAAFERAAARSRDPGDREAAAARADRLRATLPGAVWVECPAAGQVSLGPLPPQPCPARFDAVRPGVWQGAVRTAEGVERPFRVEVLGDQIHRVRIDGPAPARAAEVDWPGWVTLGGAAVVALAGALFIAHANGVAARAEDAASRGDRAGYDAFRSEHDTSTTVGYSLYAASVALAGIGLWLVLDDDDGPAAVAGSRRTAPRVHGVGVGLSLGF